MNTTRSIVLAAFAALSFAVLAVASFIETIVRGKAVLDEIQ